jgi:phosphoglycolate phosphatase-like HAD superfamily hydrolase
MHTLELKDKKVIIFDIDGTLANSDHREHIVNLAATRSEVDWDEYFDASRHDPPHYEIQWLNHIMADRDDTELVVLTARPTYCRDMTEQWLKDHDIAHSELIMKDPLPDGEYDKDYVFKEKVLDQLIAQGRKPFMVFEDRQNVVDMWRSRGIKCLQVQPGDF